jgi:hypothetical protein
MASGVSIVSQMPLKGRIGIAGASSKRLSAGLFCTSHFWQEFGLKVPQLLGHI